MRIAVFAVLPLLSFALALGVYYYVNASRKSRGIYVCDMHTLYYDPQQGKDICGRFQIKNDFSKSPIQLEIAGKSCSCVSVNISRKELGWGETSQVEVFFRTDSSSVHRKEVVVIKTSYKGLPIIQLITKVDTVPFLYIEVPEKVIPKLKPEERHVMQVKAFAYVDNEKDTDDVTLSVEGAGVSLKDVKKTMRKVNDAVEVVFDGTLVIEYDDVENYRIRNEGIVLLQRGNFKAYSEVPWVPIVPFSIEPDVVFVSSGSPKTINLKFEHPVQILKMTSNNTSIVATLVTSSTDRTRYTVNIEKIQDEIMEDVVEIIIETDDKFFKNIRVPVCVIE